MVTDTLVLTLCALAGLQQAKPAAPQPKHVRLLYSVDVAAMRRRGMPVPPEQRLVPTAIEVMRRRLTDAGVKGFELDEVGKRSLDVRLPPPKTGKQLAYWRELLEHSGALEMRMVATQDYRGGKIFDLDVEKKRLRAWLAKPDNKKLIAQDPTNIALFNNRAGTPAGPASKFLRWAPMFREPGKKPGTWKWWSSKDENEVSHFVPLNLHEPTWFSEADFIPDKFEQTQDAFTGTAVALVCSLRPGRVRALSDLSARAVGRHFALLDDGAILLAPSFRERIPGRLMMLTAWSTPADAEARAHVFRAGPPRIVLHLDKQELVR